MDYLSNERCHDLINSEELNLIEKRLIKFFYILGEEEIAVLTCSSETAMFLYLFRKQLHIENEIEYYNGYYELFENPIVIDEDIAFGKVVTGYELL